MYNNETMKPKQLFVHTSGKFVKLSNARVILWFCSIECFVRIFMKCFYDIIIKKNTDACCSFIENHTVKGIEHTGFFYTHIIHYRIGILTGYACSLFAAFCSIYLYSLHKHLSASYYIWWVVVGQANNNKNLNVWRLYIVI